MKYGDDWDKDTNDTTTIHLDKTATTKHIVASASTNIRNDVTMDQVKGKMIHSYIDSVSKSDGNKYHTKDDDTVHETKPYISTEMAGSSSSNETKPENPAADIYFDYDTMRWKPKTEQKNIPTTTPLNHNMVTTKVNSIEDTTVVVDEPSLISSSTTEEELYFDTDIMRWKTRPKKTLPNPTTTAFRKTTLSLNSIPLEDTTLKLTKELELKDKTDQDDNDDDDDDDDDDWETASDDSDEDEDYIFDKERMEWVVRSSPKVDTSASTVHEVLQGTDANDDENDDENFDLDLYYDEKDQEWKSKKTDTKNVDSNNTNKVTKGKVAILEKTEAVQELNTDVAIQEKPDTVSILPEIDQVS